MQRRRTVSPGEMSLFIILLEGLQHSYPGLHFLVRGCRKEEDSVSSVYLKHVWVGSPVVEWERGEGGGEREEGRGGEKRRGRGRKEEEKGRGGRKREGREEKEVGRRRKKKGGKKGGEKEEGRE